MHSTSRLSRNSSLTEIAQTLGEMITTQADAVRFVGTLLRVAEERQLKGFGRSILKEVGKHLPGDGADND